MQEEHLKEIHPFMIKKQQQKKNKKKNKKKLAM